MTDSVHTTTRLPKQLRSWFDARAKSEGLTTSELIRIALLEYKRGNISAHQDSERNLRAKAQSR
jgi:hypothetical protein